MNLKQEIENLLKIHQKEFLTKPQELGFFLYYYFMTNNESTYSYPNINDFSEEYLELIESGNSYVNKQLGKNRTLKNSFEGKKNKTLNEWIMVLKSTQPHIYKTDADCLKKIFLTVHFRKAWSDEGFLCEPSLPYGTWFYEDFFNCENTTTFSNESFRSLAEKIKLNIEIIKASVELDEKFKQIYLDGQAIEKSLDNMALFLDIKERYKTVDFSQINYMPLRSFPDNVDESYIEGIVRCLQSVIYNQDETDKNKKIAKKEILRLNERIKHGKHTR